jgi:hypothetical protein
MAIGDFDNDVENMMHDRIVDRPNRKVMVSL